jgi:hypothetical protein
LSGICGKFEEAILIVQPLASYPAANCAEAEKHYALCLIEPPHEQTLRLINTPERLPKKNPICMNFDVDIILSRAVYTDSARWAALIKPLSAVVLQLRSLVL